MASVRQVSDMVRDYPKEVILKDGTGVTLRPIQAEDVTLLAGMFDRFSEDDRWFLNHDVTDIDLLERWVEQNDPKRALSIVAALEGRIIASAVLKRDEFGSKNHIGKVRISVDPDFRKKRLGTWMLLDLINLGIGLGLEKLLMELVKYRDSNVIRGIRNLDFYEEAVLHNHIKDRGGNLQDLIIMVKQLHRGWEDF